MNFSLAFVLASLLFLIVAAPPAELPTSRGIAVPLIKRGNSLNGVADPSNLQSRIKSSVA